MKVLEVLKEYCFQRGQPAPEQEAGIVLDMQLGSQPVRFDFQPDAQALFLRAPLAIGDLGPSELAALYRRLLSANLSGGALSGLYFAIDDEDESIELLHRLDTARIVATDTVERAVEMLFAGTLHAAGLLSGSAAAPADMPAHLFKA